MKKNVEIFSIEQFSELYHYVIGKDCDETVQKAAFRRYEVVRGNSEPYDFLIEVNNLLKIELRKMPLSAVAERGIKKFVIVLINTEDFLPEKAIKTPSNRAKIMEILWQFVKLGQFEIVKKLLLFESDDGDKEKGEKRTPPIGHTLYRTEQKDAVLALINSLTEKYKKDLLCSTWTYYLRGGFLIGGEKIFGYGSIMPL
jgi:hypothetical protein